MIDYLAPHSDALALLWLAYIRCSCVSHMTFGSMSAVVDIPSIVSHDLNELLPEVLSQAL
jgi:hypothetical protein